MVAVSRVPGVGDSGCEKVRQWQLVGAMFGRGVDHSSEYAAVQGRCYARITDRLVCQVFYIKSRWVDVEDVVRITEPQADRPLAWLPSVTPSRHEP